MRKLKEVLRLHSLGLSQHQIARSCSISQSTVHEYLSTAQAAGVKWPAPENWNDQQIERTLFPQRPAPAIWRKHPEPDWTQIHQELQTHKDLTLQLVWQEGRESNPDGYGYSRFCDLYRRWLKKLDLVLRQEHRAGEKMFVDYAGATIPIHNPESGEVHPAAVFVAVLGASSYTFAEATTGQDLRNWIGSHMRAFEFFGGVAEVVVPDNLKSAVTHPSYYEPDLNPTYRDLGEHYGVAIIPARPYRARDKAKAEVGVQVVQRWVVAALRKRKFFSLAEVNQAIAELLVRLNQRPFRKREGSRATLFAQLDQPALKPLPAIRYQFGEWETARVNIDYHIEVERHYYSVPYAQGRENRQGCEIGEVGPEGRQGKAGNEIATRRQQDGDDPGSDRTGEGSNVGRNRHGHRVAVAQPAGIPVDRREEAQREDRVGEEGRGNSRVSDSGVEPAPLCSQKAAAGITLKRRFSLCGIAPP